MEANQTFNTPPYATVTKMLALKMWRLYLKLSAHNSPG